MEQNSSVLCLLLLQFRKLFVLEFLSSDACVFEGFHRRGEFVEDIDLFHTSFFQLSM